MLSVQCAIHNFSQNEFYKINIFITLKIISKLLKQCPDQFKKGQI